MNRTVISLLAGTLLLSAGTAIAAPSPKAAEKLSKAIAGRMAGAPVDCITQRNIQSTEIIDGLAIIYKMSGNRMYVNTPASGSAFLRSGNVLVTDTHSSQLCSVDIVRLYDQASRMNAGSIGLGKFVPYEKAKPAR